MANYSEIKGVYVATLTPLKKDLTCDDEKLAAHYKDLISRGCSGIVIFGTTGEGPSFSVKERKTSIKKLIDLGVDPKKLIVGVSCDAVEDAIELSRAILEHHCLATLIVPPSFFKNISDEGVIAFYQQIIRKIDSSELKIILYHIPQFSGVRISVNVIKKLKEEFPHNIVGIKESEGNMPFTKEILEKLPDFPVIPGNELHFSEAVSLGAKGVISGVANALPELIISLFEYGKDNKKPNHNDILKTIFQEILNYGFVSSIKKLTEKNAKDGGSQWVLLRPPLTPLNESQSLNLEKISAQYIKKI